MIRSWNALEPHLGFLLEGFALTVAACVLAVAGAVVLGALIASLRTARSRAARTVAAVYCDLFRNVPFIVQLFFFFYGLPELGIYIGAFETGVLAMSIAGGAFVADVIRAGILSIEQGVIEAARVFGLSRWQIFSRIVMPNALRVSVRPMGSVLINLVLTFAIPGISIGGHVGGLLAGAAAGALLQPLRWPQEGAALRTTVVLGLGVTFGAFALAAAHAFTSSPLL